MSDSDGVTTENADERSNYLDYLDYFRSTLEHLCEGLDPEQLATRAVPPSNLSLLGLIRHLARVEQFWTRNVFEGEHQRPRLYRTHDQPDLDFEQAEGTLACVRDAWSTWRAEVEHAREVFAEVDLEEMFHVRENESASGRDITVHLIEEYARHCGHGDLIRQCIDGRTGL